MKYMLLYIGLFFILIGFIGYATGNDGQHSLLTGVIILAINLAKEEIIENTNK